MTQPLDMSYDAMWALHSLAELADPDCPFCHMDATFGAQAMTAAAGWREDADGHWQREEWHMIAVIQEDIAKITRSVELTRMLQQDATLEAAERKRQRVAAAKAAREQAAARESKRREMARKVNALDAADPRMARDGLVEPGSMPVPWEGWTQ